jgi:hypothetical protein
MISDNYRAGDLATRKPSIGEPPDVSEVIDVVDEQGPLCEFKLLGTYEIIQPARLQQVAVCAFETVDDEIDPVHRHESVPETSTLNTSTGKPG